MERLDHTAVGALRVALDNQPLNEAKVTFAWKVSAGPALARAGAVTWRDGVLSVWASSLAWQRELERARPTILQRLRQLVGPDAVRETLILPPAATATLAGRERPVTPRATWPDPTSSHTVKRS